MLTLIKKSPNYHFGGAYGMIFFTTGCRAIKVFKRNGHPRDHAVQVFKSEVDAYEIAKNVPELKHLIPEFFGVSSIDRIEDESGKDISDEFHLDLAYEMEKIDGQFVKANLGKYAELGEIERLFHLNGIRHTSDIDVLQEKGAIKRIIDFATEKYWLEHTPII